MNWLDIVAQHHKEWKSLINQWGEYFYAEDLVQEMYIKLYNSTTEEKIIKNGRVNKSYVWFTLRSVFIDFQRGKKWEKVSIDFVHLSDEIIDVNSEKSFDIIISKIEDEIDTWHWYDSKLFRLYVSTDNSMRDLEEKTKISTSSIFTTLKDCKNRIKAVVGEDWEDYQNADYERI